MLYVFDLFTTLIQSNTAEDEGLFCLMQKELQESPDYPNISKYIRDNFIQLRIHSEELACLEYQRNGVEAITLWQIYQSLATTGSINYVEMNSLYELECKLFFENIKIVKKYYILIKDLLEKNKKVVFIGNTNFEQKLIVELLDNICEDFKVIPLYLSSAYKLKKDNEKLLRYIRSNEGAEYSSWQYWGAENKTLIRLGIKNYNKCVKWSLFERDIILQEKNNYQVQLMVGASQNACSQIEDETAKIGATVAGPILFAYAQWIVETSKQRGIKRLYFIARDGYILKKMIDILLAKWNIDIKTHYLYGSRKAWRMPSYDGSVGGLRKIIARSNPDRIKNLTDLASVLKINLTDLLVFLKNINLTEKLSYYTLNFLVKILDEDKNFRMFLLKQHQVERSVVQEYLRQEIDLVDEHFAFVEVGGTGFTQKCLYNLMKSAYSGKIYTFFLKMDRIIEDEVCKYLNFLPSKLKHDLVFELLCRAPHGQTAGYVKDDDGVKPLLQGNEGTFLKNYGYDMYIQGIEKYCELYAEQVNKYNIPVNLQIFMEYIKYVMSPKDKEILDFFSDMPYSPSGRDEEMVTFAPILTKQNIRDVYLFHPNEPFTKYYHGTDLEYAKHRCNKSEIKRIEFYQKNRERILERLQRLTRKPFVKKHTVRDNIFSGIPYSYFGDDFVIYGAGKWGIQLYEALSVENYTIVQWLDKNYHALQKKGIAVTGTLSDIVHEKNYGSIFIAISDLAVAQKIKDEFLAKGVNDSKIVMLCEYVRALEL